MHFKKPSNLSTIHATSNIPYHKRESVKSLTDHINNIPPLDVKQTKEMKHVTFAPIACGYEKVIHHRWQQAKTITNNDTVFANFNSGNDQWLTLDVSVVHFALLSQVIVATING